ncbi:hypothetical protein [Bacillus sp. FSL K6-3431]|uniref:hypothetical protein n=1 Tax=Bacillus sp. FSL K6-3431 TaxID=2921500 RepID=UPI0030FBD047
MSIGSLNEDNDLLSGSWAVIVDVMFDGGRFKTFPDEDSAILYAREIEKTNACIFVYITKIEETAKLYVDRRRM